MKVETTHDIGDKVIIRVDDDYFGKVEGEIIATRTYTTKEGSVIFYLIEGVYKGRFSTEEHPMKFEVNEKSMPDKPQKMIRTNNEEIWKGRDIKSIADDIAFDVENDRYDKKK